MAVLTQRRGELRGRVRRFRLRVHAREARVRGLSASMCPLGVLVCTRESGVRALGRIFVPEAGRLTPQIPVRNVS